MKLIDDNTKKLYWWNRNYFFAATVIIVLINIMLFGFGGSDWTSFIGGYSSGWSWAFDFDNVIRHFLNAFSHANWHHTLLNMLSFFIVGIYLERKKGTLGLLLLVLIMAFFTSTAIGANYMSINYRGYSGVNFGIYAYIIVDYCFMFINKTKSKFNIISGGVVLGFIYLSMCFCGGTSTFEFKWYPYNIMYNMGHYSSFLAGTVLGLTIQLVKFFAPKEVDKIS